MTDPVDVGRALAALATPDTVPAPDDDPSHARVVSRAQSAFSTVDGAARFLDDGGEVRLRRAVGEAARVGDHDCARTGRTLLRDLERLRAALAGEDGSRDIDDAACPATDHFHSGRTTVFTGGGEAEDR